MTEAVTMGQLNPDERFNISEAAASFLEAGIERVERGDLNRARVLLDAAEKLYRKADDELSLAVVKAWYDPLRIGLAAHR